MRVRTNLIPRRCRECKEELWDTEDKYGHSASKPCNCDLCTQYWLCWDCGEKLHENPMPRPEKKVEEKPSPIDTFFGS